MITSWVIEDRKGETSSVQEKKYFVIKSEGKLSLNGEKRSFFK